MRNKIKRWLNRNHLRLELLTAKWRIAPIAISEAAEVIYDNIQKGEKIKQISIGWRIRALALSISRMDNIKEVENIRTARRTVRYLKRQLRYYGLPWYKKLFTKKDF